MKRGEIWSLRDRQYASKARPVVIIQSDKHESFDSVILCLFTTYDSSGIQTRVLINASLQNGSFYLCSHHLYIDRNNMFVDSILKGTTQFRRWANSVLKNYILKG